LIFPPVHVSEPLRNSNVTGLVLVEDLDLTVVAVLIAIPKVMNLLFQDGVLLGFPETIRLVLGIGIPIVTLNLLGLMKLIIGLLVRKLPLGMGLIEGIELKEVVFSIRSRGLMNLIAGLLIRILCQLRDGDSVVVVVVVIERGE
jgi:hypothetical protein